MSIFKNIKGGRALTPGQSHLKRHWFYSRHTPYTFVKSVYMLLWMSALRMSRMSRKRLLDKAATQRRNPKTCRCSIQQSGKKRGTQLNSRRDRCEFPCYYFRWKLLTVGYTKPKYSVYTASTKYFTQLKKCTKPLNCFFKSKLYYY